MQWTDANGQKHHDMGTCHCGEHHAFDEINALREENRRLADTLREIADALTETLQHPDHVSDEVRKERNRHAVDLIARAALDRHTKANT